MITVHVEKVNSYSFTGYIYKHELTEAQQLLFPGPNSTIDVEGDFYVDSKDTQLIEIHQIIAFCGKAHLYLENADFNADEVYFELLKQIEKHESYYDASEPWAGV